MTELLYDILAVVLALVFTVAFSLLILRVITIAMRD